MNTRFEIINGKCEIPAGISEIEDMAFCDCQELREVVIPEGVKRIGSHAFCDCRSLKEVLLPDSLEIIDVCAFNSCYNLKKIRIPKSVKRVDLSKALIGKKLGKITLHVPAGSEDLYRQHPFFKKFKNVVV